MPILHAGRGQLDWKCPYEKVGKKTPWSLQVEISNAA